MYIYHSFLIHSSADGHLGCFHVLAIINSAAMNIGVHVSISVLVSLVCIPRSEIAGSYGSSISSCLTEKYTQRKACVLYVNKNLLWGNSLMVQWLRLHLLMQEVQVQSLVRELRFHISCSQKKSKPKTEAIL